MEQATHDKRVLRKLKQGLGLIRKVFANGKSEDLAAMSDHLLKDIGIRPEEIRRLNDGRKVRFVPGRFQDTCRDKDCCR